MLFLPGIVSQEHELEEDECRLPADPAVYDVIPRYGRLFLNGQPGPLFLRINNY
jgi:hypothetical protein